MVITHESANITLITSILLHSHAPGDVLLELCCGGNLAQKRNAVMLYFVNDGDVWVMSTILKRFLYLTQKKKCCFLDANRASQLPPCV